MQSIIYKELKENEINISLFSSFNRYQEVKKCWRKEDGEWILKDMVFTEQWGPEEFKSLVEGLHDTLKSGGAVIGAFSNDVLVGFASIENEFFGSKKEYLELSSLHTSYESRGMGIGKTLFSLMCRKAKEMGAQKLYISTQSSQETQAFYKAVGCVEAVEYNYILVEKEPFDCHLEFSLY
jgi:ribosomal protein S18 acetylase RimI-like enzyme